MWRSLSSANVPPHSAKCHRFGGGVGETDSAIAACDGRCPGGLTDVHFSLHPLCWLVLQRLGVGRCTFFLRRASLSACRESILERCFPMRVASDLSRLPALEWQGSQFFDPLHVYTGNEFLFDVVLVAVPYSGAPRDFARVMESGRDERSGWVQHPICSGCSTDQLCQ